MNGLQKFYIGLWVGFGLITVGLALTGNLTMLALIVLGFTSFGLIFMGMMCVLPSTVTQVATFKAPPVKIAREKAAVVTAIKIWLDPVGVEMKKAQFR